MVFTFQILLPISLLEMDCRYWTFQIRPILKRSATVIPPVKQMMFMYRILWQWSLLAKAVFG